jgi:hypothetical protein
LQRFNAKTVYSVSLSRLRAAHDRQDGSIVDILSRRHIIDIDECYLMPTGQGQIHMDTKVSMIDYHLTVGRSIGLAPIVPNSLSTHRFTFDLDLQKPHRFFKGKHAMLGFDPNGCMLYIGRAMHEDVFLAMAPNEFLRGRSKTCPPGFSSGSPLMSRRHYRQIVVMLVHFLHRLPQFPYIQVNDDLYSQNLGDRNPRWDLLTTAL